MTTTRLGSNKGFDALVEDTTLIARRVYQSTPEICKAVSEMSTIGFSSPRPFSPLQVPRVPGALLLENSSSYQLVNHGLHQSDAAPRRRARFPTVVMRCQQMLHLQSISQCVSIFVQQLRIH